jgi:hypothetical protein
MQHSEGPSGRTNELSAGVHEAMIPGGPLYSARQFYMLAANALEIVQQERLVTRK